jgi:DNA primase
MDLKDIKSKIVLSTIISKHIKLIKKNYLYWGNCIFHKEKTPSFAVNDEKEYYHCFGCGSHGDVFSFLMEVSKKPFHQILEELCDIYKIPYKKHLEYQPQNKVQEILLESMELYKGFLEKNLEVKNFLLKRGITQEYIDKFQLGYAPQNGTIIQLLKIHSITSLKDAGLVSMGSYDRLRNRIIFPILNEKNKPIAFAGRSLSNEKPKYINSNETLLFHKNLCLYNINNLPMQVEEIFLVEGYIDVITMTRCGFVNTVASMGTSVSKSQLFILLRRTRKLYLLFDGDEGGKMASQRTINLLLEMLIPGYSIQIGLLPQEEDPDSYLSKYDVNSLKNYFKDIVDILMDYIIKDLNLDKVEDLSSAFNRMNIYINLINNESVKSSYKIIL